MKKTIGILLSGMLIAGVANAESTFNFKFKVKNKNMTVSPMSGEGSTDDGSVDLGGIGGGSVTPPASNITFDKMTCSIDSCYGLKDGNIYSTGSGGYGKLGFNDYNDRFVWTKTEISGVDDIAAVDSAVFYLKNGSVYQRGYNYPLNSGLNELDLNFSGVTKICSGVDTLLALKDGDVYGIGRNYYYQSGVNGRNLSVFTKSNSINNVKDIFCGGYYSYAITNNGDVYSVGMNGSGQLGNGSTSNQSQWYKTNMSGKNVKDIALGDNFAYMLLENGDLYNIGSGNSKFGYTPLKVWTDTGVKNVERVFASTGSYSGFFIKNGKLNIAGSNNYGQLGTGDTVSVNYTYLETEKECSDFYGNRSYSFCINETVEATGYNASYALGLGHNDNVLTWTPIVFE